MPLNLTNTIHLVNIPPNLINFIYDSKLNNKMNEMFILGLHGIYYTEQAVQDVRPLQVRCTSAEKSTECCPQDPGQAPGPTPAMHGPPPPLPSQPPAPARERATGQPGSSSAEPQLKKKEFRE